MKHPALLMTRSDGELWILSQQAGLRQLPDEAWRTMSLRTCKVRLLGTAENAPVIHWLAGTTCQVTLGTPRLLATQLERENPRRILLAMQQVSQHWLPPSLGGWHRCTPLDVVIYGMGCPARRTELQQLHPVWQACVGFQGFNMDRLGDLLSEIRDPRWFVDCQHPDRTSRLRAYLGLHCQQTKRLSTAANIRRVLAEAVWRGSEIQSPETNFLWQFWHERRQVQSEERATLATTQRLVAFLRYLWLAVLQAESAEPLFDPRVFLQDAELAGFVSHVSGCRWCIGA